MRGLTFGAGSVLGHRRRHGWVWLFIVAGSVLAAVGVPGVSQSAALPGSLSGPTWTQQTPATSPIARDDASMAYDAATGSVVLFGGLGPFADTWTWG